MNTNILSEILQFLVEFYSFELLISIFSHGIVKNNYKKIHSSHFDTFDLGNMSRLCISF